MTTKIRSFEKFTFKFDSDKLGINGVYVDVDKEENEIRLYGLSDDELETTLKKLGDALGFTLSEEEEEEEETLSETRTKEELHKALVFWKDVRGGQKERPHAEDMGNKCLFEDCRRETDNSWWCDACDPKYSSLDRIVDYNIRYLTATLQTETASPTVQETNPNPPTQPE